MAHELSIRADGKAEMAFIGGTTPWHGLGQSVTKGASIGVWRKEAGMDWEAKEAPVLFTPDGVTMLGRSAQAVPTHKVIYRGDSGAPLGVVSEKYNIVQPVDALEFFRDLCEDEGWHIHTAGVLRGGRKLWVMATNGQLANVAATVRGKLGDQVINQLLFATSLDGSMKTVVKECATVVVCANTLARGLRENGKGILVSHRSVFDAQAVKKSLGLAAGSFDGFMRNARLMAETPIKLDEALGVLRGIFGQPKQDDRAKVNTSWMGSLTDAVSADEPDAPDEKEARAAGRCLELFKGAGIGASLPGRVDTRWGLFNAVTQFVDHEMGRTPDTRLDSAWFGRGDSIKQSAYEALGEAVA